MDETLIEEDLIQYQEYLLGKQADEFFSTPVGRYVLGRSLLESQEATKKLKDADANEPKIIRELQNRIKISEKAVRWIAEAIRDGKTAQEQLEIDDDLREEQP